MNVLEMEYVTIQRGNQVVVEDVSLYVQAGEVVTIRGPSGSGKTSLLHAAAGLLPWGGAIHIMGKRLQKKAANQRRQHIGMVFQGLGLLPELTLKENVELGMKLKGQKADSKEILQAFGISALANRLPHEVSGGEQQRAAIARAMLLKPDLLLVDEPTSALDKDTSARVIDALHVAASLGAGVLVSTHDDLMQGHRDYQIHGTSVTQ